MWYFSWVLGVSFAVSFSIFNAMWLEQKELDTGERAGAAGEAGRAGRF
jgi:cyd operon protein YbgT